MIDNILYEGGANLDANQNAPIQQEARQQITPEPSMVLQEGPMNIMEGEVDAVEDVVAMVATKYKAPPEEAVQKTEALVKSIISKYPEMGDKPIQFLRDVLIPHDLGTSSANLPIETKVQKAHVDKKQTEAKGNIIGALEDYAEEAQGIVLNNSRHIYRRLKADGKSALYSFKDLFAENTTSAPSGPDPILKEHREAYQRQLGFTGRNVDGVIGSGTYSAIVADLGGDKSLADKVTKELYKDKLFATGKYQFIPETLDALSTRTEGVTKDSIYNSTTQDALFKTLLDETLSLSRAMTTKQRSVELAKVWASLPVLGSEAKSPVTGSGATKEMSYFNNDGVNRSSHTIAETEEAIESYLQTGDIETLQEFIAQGEAVGGSYSSKNAGVARLSDGKDHVLHSGVSHDLETMTIGEILRRR